MAFALAERLKKLPPYIFLEIDKLKKQALADGVDILDFGVGDPDIETPEPIVAEMKKAITRTENHQYPFGSGKAKLRQACADFYSEKYNVQLDAKEEITALIGAKEGIAHMAFAFINPGDTVLMPDPAYPVYFNGTVFADGEPVFIPMDEENDYQLDMESIPPDVLQRAKMLWMNFPHSPTGTCVDESFFEKIVWYAQKYDFAVCHDAAYIDLTYDGYKAPSFLSVPGAKEVGCEFYSLSKPFNMTGWRLGFCVGNKELVAGLSKIKGNIDSGQFAAVQDAGIVAFQNHEEFIGKMVKIYTERRNLVIEGLRAAGWEVNTPKGTIYLWVKCPQGMNSMDTSAMLLKQYGILATPGIGLGVKHGEGHVRFSLTSPTENCIKALDRLKQGGM